MFALNLHVLLLIIDIILGCAAFAALSSCGELHVYALFVFHKLLVTVYGM